MMELSAGSELTLKRQANIVVPTTLSSGQWTDGESGGEGRLVTRLGGTRDSDPWR